MFDVIIVGGGPAALAATMFLQQKAVKTLLIYEELGGKASWTHNRQLDGQTFHLPAHDLVNQLIQTITSPDQPVHHVQDRVSSITRDEQGFTVVCQREGSFQAIAVIIATGTTPTKLELPGIQHLLGFGFGYSITTFAHQVQTKRVAVVGITPRTIRGIAEIIQSAEYIYLLSDNADIPDVPLFHMIQRAQNVQLMLNTRVHEVIGINTVKRLVVEHNGDLEQLHVDFVFVDLGLRPNTEFLADLGITDAEGFIIVDEYNSTLCHGLFAAGDVTTSVAGEQILIAIGAGARAALATYEYLLIHQLTNSTHH